MAKKNSTISTNASDCTIEGLAATIAKLETEKNKSAEQKARDAARQAKQQDKIYQRLCLLRDTKNPQIRPDTLRQADPGELINDKPAKGWVVRIECEVCGGIRLVNTQDAFQARVCLRAECRSKSGKGRVAQRVKELSSLTVEELQARLAELQAA